MLWLAKMEGAHMSYDLRMEGRPLPITLASPFERFYRSSVRHVGGSRIRARELWDSYHAWARLNDEPTMTFSALRQQMELAGHRRIQSNGVRYVDAGFAASYPDIADNLPNPFRGSPQSTTTTDASPLLSKLDAALAALLDLRHAIIANGDRANPAEAAQRVLGLFER
ncbi:hypothetical protein E5673_08605 [Sphingomonas sp. PAMC26645]|uniref:hypothetical protein n=1 Tax=Sphingomonas sp. PAMC26645 TaxID=2565555 RepID=UPI00109DDC77|nr:hypothetical protein [Sphingomonas sp. PAMC26645]QCB42285.1 hypothetical protein E5673_08605 [Sphingomonas sp. PAMC26645]